MKSHAPIEESRHAEFFAQALKEMQAITVNAGTSIIGDSVAVNRQLAEFLADSRKLVEDEAVLTIDAMTLAFDDKAGKLKSLKSATEKVSAEVAFMKTSLNTIETKTGQIEAMTASIDALCESISRFKAMVDGGVFDVAAKAAAAISE